MASLSAALFAWDKDDLQLLRRTELMGERLCPVSDRDVDEAITREELARHCRRQVRAPAAIRATISDVVATFSGAGGPNAMAGGASAPVHASDLA